MNGDAARGSGSKRVLGVDVGERRVGLAISNPSGTIARPLRTLHVAGATDAVTKLEGEIARLAREDEGLAAVVVGMPRRLDGSATGMTPKVVALIAALGARTKVPIVSEDERLTSREAESRLALRERDWRRRKDTLDAAAAALILQDHLDRRT